MYTSLVIGLGGTGSSALAQLKQRLVTDGRYMLLDKGLDAVTKPEYDKVNFPVRLHALDVDKKSRPLVGDLRLDTNIEEDISLSARIGDALADIQMYDSERGSYKTVRKWLDREEAKQFKLPAAAKFMQEGLGEIRQFGRLVFFVDIVHDQQITQIRSTLDRLVNMANGQQVNIYVACSVAGGTGAGLLVDTLAYLDYLRHQTAGQVPFRVTGFIVLPGAFAGVLGTEQLDVVKANGMAALRELDRQMNSHDTFRVEWKLGDVVTLHEPVLDLCYLLDGSRDVNDGPQLEAHKPFETGLPVAIADAIYAHVFPPSGHSLASDYANLLPAIIAGAPYRYSSLGVYSITYAWEPLMRSLGLRLLDEALDLVLSDSRSEAKSHVLEFLTGGAVGNLQLGDKTQTIPSFLSLLTQPPQLELAPVAFWTIPSDNTKAAPIPGTPELKTYFPNLGFMKTDYEHDQVFAKVEEVIDEFWGPVDGVWTGQARPQFHPAVNHNIAQSVREWTRALRLACAAIMNRRDKIGGVSIAHEFTLIIESHLDLFLQKLARVPRPNLAVAEAALSDAIEATKDRRRMDNWKEQKDYLEAHQSLLNLQAQDWALRLVTELVGELLSSTRLVKSEVEGWRSHLESLRTRGRELRVAIDDQRRGADESPLQRYVPLPGDPTEEALRAECLGVENAAGTTEGLMKVLRTISFDVYEPPLRPDDSRIVYQRPAAKKTSEEPSPITLADLESVALVPFAGLRSRSVFEILELAGEKPGAVVDELKTYGARLATYDAGKQMKATDLKGRVHRNWNVVFADWMTEGPGSGFAQKAAELLEETRVTPKNIGGAADGLPTRDKIIAYSARHLLVLDAFAGVGILENAYKSHKAEIPSPHILPEERGAALLEHRSHQLMKQGLLVAALERVAPEHVVLCAEPKLLEYVAACVAAGLIKWEVKDPVEGTGVWTVSHGTALTEIGSDGDFGSVLARIFLDEGHESIVARRALTDAGRDAARGAAQQLAGLAKDGWVGPGVPEHLSRILQVAAASLAAKLAP